MTPEEMNRIETEAKRILEECTTKFIEALVLYTRMKIQKDLAFIESGDIAFTNRR